MRVWLVDFDGKMENLALMKLSTYHKSQGDEVVLKRGFVTPELWDNPDKLYASCLFSWNRKAALGLYDVWGNMIEIGGTGVDPATELDADVVNCEPDYSLYGRDRAVGFISRGCIRKCPWCVVPRKEGKLRRVSSAAEVVGDRQKVVFLDNNFLALDDHIEDLRWLRGSQVPIDFNQGLDARLITSENAELLAACRWPKGLRLALDSDSQIAPVDQALELLQSCGFNPARVVFYVLLGFSGLISDVRRLLHLGAWRASIFPMGYRELSTGKQPARGWNSRLYRKYKVMMIQKSRSKSTWEQFVQEVVDPRWVDDAMGSDIQTILDRPANKKIDVGIELWNSNHFVVPTGRN